jgi:zinc protease
LIVVGLVAALGAACQPVAMREPRPATADATAAVDGDLVGLPSLGATAAGFALPAVIERRLANGLTLLVVEDRTLPLVVFHLVVPGGSAFDPPGQAGAAALTADLVRKGTARRSAEDLAREIEFLGGTLAGSAGTDFSSVSGEFLSKDLAAAFDLFGDVALAPTFPEDELRRARALMLAGVVAAREDPSAIAGRCFDAYLYGAHPYGRPGSGTEDSLATLDRAAVERFYRHHYVPDGAVLVVIGAVPAVELTAVAEATFGSWRSQAGGQPLLPLPVRVTGRRLLLVDKADATQAHIRIGNVGIARTDPDYVPAGVASTILGEGFGARLLDELRVKRSLTYSAWSGFNVHRMPGDFRAGTFSKVETTGEALRVALDVLRDFAAAGGTAAELARAQSLRTGQYPRQLETQGALAANLASLYVFGLPFGDLEAYPDRVMAVTLDDVRRIAATYVPTEDAAIVVVGPAATIEPQLAGLGIVEHTTPQDCDRPGGPSAVR